MEVYRDEEAGPPGTGWLFFAGTILGLAGIMRIIDSIWAFGYKGALPDGLRDGVLGSNLKHYAWAWLIVGIVLVISSFLILMRSQFARWVGFFVDAVLPGLVADVHRDRRPYFLCTGPLRRPSRRVGLAAFPASLMTLGRDRCVGRATRSTFRLDLRFTSARESTANLF
jgi:hypothetical protein